MSDDSKKLPPADDHTGDTGSVDGPSQWARREEGTVANTEAGDEGRASFLDDDQMSLDSKLRGGGRDLAPSDERDETRLCPACSTVNKFIDGTCTNCQFKIGSGSVDDIQDIRSAAIGTGEDPAKRTILIVALAAVVLIILVVGLPKLFGSKSPTQNNASTSRVVETSAQSGDAYAGTLNEIPIDDSFNSNLNTAIEAGNTGWANEGIDAYVYRYTLGNRVVPATSQTFVFQMFVGGADAKTASDAPGNVAFNLGFADFLDSLNARSGVRGSVSLKSTKGLSIPDKNDVYLRYGYYYGLEHMNELQPIIDALDEYYKANGEYPHLLRTNLTTNSIRTRQGYFFLANGFGYLPVFKTDSSGNIVMGTGAGLDSLNPEKCQGYYLVMYANSDKVGLDLHNSDNEHYYQTKISPFPYENKDGVHNVILTPDGEPDGITCVVKDGVLLDL